MLGVLLSVAIAATPLSAAAEPRVVPVPEGTGGAEVDGGALFSDGYLAARSQVVRFGLATGAQTVLYTAPDRQASITALEVGGGRLAITVNWNLRTTKVLLLDPLTGGASLIARGRNFFRRDCGSGVKLEDVSDAGDILVTSATVPCGRRRGTLRIRAFRREGPPLDLVRRPTGTSFVSDGPPYHSLEGSYFLTWGERRGRVRDLESTAVRRFAVKGSGRVLGEVAVDSGGRLLRHEYALRGRRLRQLVRLGDRVIFRSADLRTSRAAEARFCGNRPVLHVRGRRYERLSLLDPPLLLRDGRPRTWDTRITCDGDQYVVVDGDRPRAFVYDLPE